MGGKNDKVLDKGALKKILESHGMLGDLCSGNLPMMSIADRLGDRLDVHGRVISRMRSEGDFYAAKNRELRRDLLTVGLLLAAGIATSSSFANSLRAVAGEHDQDDLTAIDCRLTEMKEAYAAISPTLREIAVRDGVKDFSVFFERHAGDAIIELAALGGRAVDGLAGFVRDGLGKVREAFGGDDDSEEAESPPPRPDTASPKRPVSAGYARKKPTKK